MSVLANLQKPAVPTNMAASRDDAVQSRELTSGGSAFLDLPGEIRNIIYEYFLTQTGVRRRCIEKQSDVPKQVASGKSKALLFPLSSVNQQLRTEFLPLNIAQLRIKLYVTEFDDFFKTFGRTFVHYKGQYQCPRDITVILDGGQLSLDVLPLMNMRLLRSDFKCSFVECKGPKSYARQLEQSDAVKFLKALLTTRREPFRMYLKADLLASFRVETKPREGRNLVLIILRKEPFPEQEIGQDWVKTAKCKLTELGFPIFKSFENFRAVAWMKVAPNGEANE